MTQYIFIYTLSKIEAEFHWYCLKCRSFFARLFDILPKFLTNQNFWGALEVYWAAGDISITYSFKKHPGRVRLMRNLLLFDSWKTLLQGLG